MLDQGNEANLSRRSDRLYRTSNCIARVVTYMPFLALLTLAFGKQYSALVAWLGFDGPSSPIFPFLRTQRDFLISKGAAVGLDADFQLFELFIWASSAVGLLRVLTGLCSMPVLESFRGKLDRWKMMGRSNPGFIGVFLVGGPFALFWATHFDLAYTSDVMRSILAYSPEGFLSVQVFAFCGGVFFSSEGFLFLVWLLLFRNRVKSR